VTQVGSQLDQRSQPERRVGARISNGEARYGLAELATTDDRAHSARPRTRIAINGKGSPCGKPANSPGRRWTSPGGCVAPCLAPPTRASWARRCNRRGIAVTRTKTRGHHIHASSNTSMIKCLYVEVMRRYSNRSDLLEPVLDVLRRIKAGDQEDEPGGVQSRQVDSLRPSDRLCEVDIQEISERFRAGEPKLRLAVEYDMSLSTIKRLLRKHQR
jgi:hypothetical protein